MNKLTSDLCEHIDELLEEAEEKKIVFNLKKIRKIFTAKKVSYKMNFPNRMVCPALENRDGTLMLVDHMQKLIGDVLDHGCDEDECDPMAAEIPPEKFEKVFNENMRFAMASQGRVPPPCEQVKVMCVTTTHFSSGLRAVEARCKHYDPELTDDCGRLDLEKIRSRDQEYARLVEGGSM